MSHLQKQPSDKAHSGTGLADPCALSHHEIRSTIKVPSKPTLQNPKVCHPLTPVRLKLIWNDISIGSATCVQTFQLILPGHNNPPLHLAVLQMQIVGVVTKLCQRCNPRAHGSEWWDTNTLGCHASFNSCCLCGLWLSQACAVLSTLKCTARSDSQPGRTSLHWPQAKRHRPSGC